MQRICLVARAAALVALLALLLPDIALAHEKRVVGKYTFVVGFLNEPSLQGQPSGLDLTIADASGNPVDGAESTLNVAIGFGGGAPKELPLRARFGLKGQYTADVIPTKAGTYSFIFSGTVNGDAVNETFESGPGRFDDVVSPTGLQFPPVAGAADPTQQAQAANDAAQTALQRATLLGGGGLVAGVIGLIVGVVALTSRSRPAGR